MLDAGQVEEANKLPEIRKLSESAQSLYTDYFRLNTTRTVGMGISPISWLNVESYANLRHYGEYETYLLHLVVETLDPIHMAHVNEQQSKPKKDK